MPSSINAGLFVRSSVRTNNSISLVKAGDLAAVGRCSTRRRLRRLLRHRASRPTSTNVSISTSNHGRVRAAAAARAFNGSARSKAPNQANRYSRTTGAREPATRRTCLQPHGWHGKYMRAGRNPVNALVVALMIIKQVVARNILSRTYLTRKRTLWTDQQNARRLPMLSGQKTSVPLSIFAQEGEARGD